MGEFDTGATAASPAASVGSGDTSAASPVATATSPDSGSQPSVGTGPAATTTTATDQTPGPIPYERFREVNERMKASEQAAQRWQQVQQQYGDLSQVDPNVYRAAMDLAQRLRSNPVDAVTSLYEELAGNDQYRGQLASQAARVLQGLRRAQPQEEPEPQPDLMAENGSPVYSAQQQRAWMEWNQRKLQTSFDEKLAAATKPLQEMTREREIAKVTQHANVKATEMYKRAQTWPHFSEHEAKIKEAWQSHFNDWTLQDAYIHVLQSDILPKLPMQAQAKVVADLQQKAAANSLNPSSQSTPATPDFKGDFLAALKWNAENKR